jgi:hypothetical protein
VMSEETFLTLNTKAFPDVDPDEVLSW